MNSGWNWHPRNQGWPFISMISTRVPSGEMPDTIMPRFFKLVAVLDIELIAVAVALLHGLLLIRLVRQRARLEDARICTKPHRSALIRILVARLHLVVAVDKFLDEIYQGKRGLFVEFTAVRILASGKMAPYLDNGKLHTET